MVGTALTSVLLGIAAQQSLSNIFAGMVLLLSRPFRVGDAIQLHAGALGGQLQGVVTEIGITYIRLDTGETVMSVPNSQVLAAAVGPIPDHPEEPAPSPAPEADNPVTRPPAPAPTSNPAPARLPAAYPIPVTRPARLPAAYRQRNWHRAASLSELHLGWQVRAGPDDARWWRCRKRTTGHFKTREDPRTRDRQ